MYYEFIGSYEKFKGRWRVCQAVSTQLHSESDSARLDNEEHIDLIFPVFVFIIVTAVGISLFICIYSSVQPSQANTIEICLKWFLSNIPMSSSTPMVPSHICKALIQLLALWPFTDNSLDVLLSLPWKTQCLFFPKISSNVDSPDHRTCFHGVLVHLTWARTKRTW